MARIRSIHPALFTDEAFVSVSMPARVMLLGLWTEADDQGVFDWKPVTLKMRIMPVDNVDVSALLEELRRADIIRSFEDDGKRLGAIRNFCKFQRPKTPKYRPIKSADIRNYVASSYKTSEIIETDAVAFPQNGEMASQMEEEGGKREEEEESLSLPEERASADDDGFEDFKQAYPRRDGQHPWDAARKKFLALTKTGVPAALIVQAARQFSSEEGKRGNLGTRFIPAPAKWLAERRFQDYAAASFEQDATVDWDAVLKSYRTTGHWSRWAGPDPESPACRAPPEMLAKYGLMIAGTKPDLPKMQSMQ